MKRALSIFLAVLILLSNTGITMAQHYCMGRVIETSFSLDKTHLSCNMLGFSEEAFETQALSNQASSKGCCQNKHLRYELKDKFLTKKNNSNHFTKLVPLYFYNAVGVSVPLPENIVLIKKDSSPPPLLVFNYQIAYQSFLL